MRLLTVFSLSRCAGNGLVADERTNVAEHRETAENVAVDTVGGALLLSKRRRRRQRDVRLPAVVEQRFGP